MTPKPETDLPKTDSSAIAVVGTVSAQVTGSDGQPVVFPPVPEETPLAAHLRSELLLLLNQPLTPKTCNRILRVAKAAKDTLRAVANQPLSRRQPLLGINDMIDDEYIAEGITGIPMNAETMGTSATQELLASLKGTLGAVSAPRIDQLIVAYSNAKKAGLTDVAEKLKKKVDLMVTDDPRLGAPPNGETKLLSRTNEA